MKRISWAAWVVTSLMIGTSFSPAVPAVPKGTSKEVSYHLTTVSWVISVRNDINADDRYVTLIGHVTGRINDDGYYFTDGTGTIRLDSADFKLPIGEKIVVGGRIDQAYLGIGHLEVDVRHWEYAKHRS